MGLLLVDTAPVKPPLKNPSDIDLPQFYCKFTGKKKGIAKWLGGGGVLWDCMMLTTEALCFNSEWDTKCEMWQMAALGFGINIFRDITCPYVMPLHSYIQQFTECLGAQPRLSKEKK